jgi:hypothetical protein
MCAKPDIKIYINHHHHHKSHLKMWLTSGSHSCVTQTSLVSNDILLIMNAHICSYFDGLNPLFYNYKHKLISIHDTILMLSVHKQIRLIHISFHNGIYNILISKMQHSTNMCQNFGAFSSWCVWWEKCLAKNVLSEFQCTCWFGRCSVRNNRYTIKIKWDVITTYATFNRHIKFHFTEHGT